MESCTRIQKAWHNACHRNRLTSLDEYFIVILEQTVSKLLMFVCVFVCFKGFPNR